MKKQNMKEQIERLIVAEQDDWNDYRNRALEKFEELRELLSEYRHIKREMEYSKGRLDAFKVALAMLEEKED